MKLVFANWKLHLPLPEAVDYAKDIFNHTQELARQTEIVLFVPHTQLFAVSAVVQNTFIGTGAQDCSRFSEGAYTGEVSARMCAAAGAVAVLIGHSERRRYFGEIEPHLQEKLSRALEADLEPVLCVGETLDQRQKGEIEKILRQQLSVLGEVDLASKRLLIAYEPVWAIGTGVNASPEQIEKAHALICHIVGEIKSITPLILYGGSVSPANIREIMAIPSVAGVLVGGASLKLETFLPLVREAANFGE